MRRLVLVRHGESIYNDEGRIQGQQCAGLSELGHAQVKRTALALAETYPDARLVTSDLQRTVETAAPLEEALDRRAARDPRLRERRFGRWEGFLRHEVIDAEPELWQRWLQGEDVIPEVGGESSEELADRVVPVYEELLAGMEDGQVTIAVTHGGPIWHGVHRLLALPTPVLGGVGNCAVTRIDAWSAGSYALARWNEVAHLPVGMRSTWRPANRSDGPPVGR